MAGMDNFVDSESSLADLRKVERVGLAGLDCIIHITTVLTGFTNYISSRT